MNKTLKSVVLIFSLVTGSWLLFTGSAYAFVLRGAEHVDIGARQMGMGGAFVAVADDSTAVYYNPAGLASLRKRELSINSVVDGALRDEVDHDDALIYVEPDKKYGAWGLFFINSGYKGKTKTTRWTSPEYHYGASWGKRIFKGFSIGGTAKYIYSRHEVKGVSGVSEATDDNIFIDIGLLYTPVRWLRFGLLIQNINEPTLWEVRWDTYYRPGVALVMPWRWKTILAYDMYDATEVVDSTYCAGLEQWLGKHFILRGGIYQEDNPTGGIGLRIDGREGLTYKIDYAYMHRRWFEDDVHWIGFGVAF